MCDVFIHHHRVQRFYFYVVFPEIEKQKEEEEVEDVSFVRPTSVSQLGVL
jgi:hypothetical protein